MLKHLINAYKKWCIPINANSSDPDLWYKKRDPEDGKIDF
jgi:hypothetical protein